MLQLLVGTPTQMLGLLSDIWISICRKHGEIKKSVHLKSLGAFHSLFNNLVILKKNFIKVVVKYINHQDMCWKQSQSIFWQLLYICGLPSHSVYHNMPPDCPHVHYTTMCHLTVLTIITQYTIWLPSCSLCHSMPPDCPHVHNTTTSHLTALMFIIPQYVMRLPHVHCTIQ